MKAVLRGSLSWMVPKAVGRTFYLPFIKLAQSRIRRVLPGADVWPRHSFLTEAFTPLISDLDLTVYWNQWPTSLQKRSLISEVRDLTNVAPIVSELNYWTPDNLQLAGEIANPYELSRDPKINRFVVRDFSKAERLPTESARACAIVFLLRNLDADAAMLTRVPHLRWKKWKLHLESVRTELGPICLRELERRFLNNEAVDALCEVLFESHPFFAEYSPSRLAEYIKWRATGATPEELWPRASRASIWVALYPHRFTGHPALSEWVSRSRDHSIFWEQLAWEAVGISTQIPWLKGDWDPVAHFDRLLDWAETLRNLGARSEDVKLGLDRVRGWTR